MLVVAEGFVSIGVILHSKMLGRCAVVWCWDSTSVTCRQASKVAAQCDLKRGYAKEW